MIAQLEADTCTETAVVQCATWVSSFGQLQAQSGTECTHAYAPRRVRLGATRSKSLSKSDLKAQRNWPSTDRARFKVNNLHIWTRHSSHSLTGPSRRPHSAGRGARQEAEEQGVPLPRDFQPALFHSLCQWDDCESGFLCPSHSVAVAQLLSKRGLGSQAPQLVSDSLLPAGWPEAQPQPVG